MIDRHMKQAKRLDNGELVQGYYRNVPNQYPVIYTNDEHEFFNVDPTTVEDVAVKPLLEIIKAYEYGNCDDERYYCGNCNTTVHYNYCHNCGQRIDWSGDDGE